MGLVTFALCAAGATALALASPVALTSMGFTTIGPAAGSFAARWMAGVAIANGGAVPAGSMYATLQSAAMGGVAWFKPLMIAAGVFM